MTFKSSLAIQEVARWAPLDRILVETDSPYLAPIPKRGKPNEPAYVVHTAHRVAELRGIAFEALAEATTVNAERAFRRRFARVRRRRSPAHRPEPSTYIQPRWRGSRRRRTLVEGVLAG